MARSPFFYLGIVILVSFGSIVSAEEPLKPGQQKAKNAMMEDSTLQSSLKRTNEACGTELKITADFSSYSAEELPGQSVSSRVSDVVLAIKNVCDDKAYKPFLVKAINTIHVEFGGRGGLDITPNLKIVSGTLMYKMNKENGNIQETTAKFIRKELDK